MEMTKFEVKATAPNGDCFEMDFELPGTLNAAQWDESKAAFQQFLSMATPMTMTSTEEVVASPEEVEVEAA